MKKVNNDQLTNDEFIEEVSIDELHEDRVIKHNKYILILIILIFISLFLLLIGMYFNMGNLGGVSVIKDNTGGVNDLLIVHSKSEFGDNISLNSYTSENNSYSYLFSIKNDSDKLNSYKLILHDSKFNSAVSCKKSKLNYSLLSNDKVVKTGTMEDIEDFILYSTTIDANSFSNYELKIWSTNGCTGSLNFKIYLEY